MGQQLKKIIKTSEKGDTDVEKFKDQASSAYISCAIHLQQKMPLNNDLLKSISCADPAVRGHEAGSQGLKQLSQHLKLFFN